MPVTVFSKQIFSFLSRRDGIFSMPITTNNRPLILKSMLSTKPLTRRTWFRIRSEAHILANGPSILMEVAAANVGTFISEYIPYHSFQLDCTYLPWERVNSCAIENRKVHKFCTEGFFFHKHRVTQTPRLSLCKFSPFLWLYSINLLWKPDWNEHFGATVKPQVHVWVCEDGTHSAFGNIC